MTRPATLEHLLELSRQRYELKVSADWRYPQFFNFLQVSPSYRLAHLVAAKAIDPANTPLPADFELVQKTYEAFGDVYETYFYDWWIKRAQFQFGVSITPQARVIMDIGFKQEITEEQLVKANEDLSEFLLVDLPAQGQVATLVVAIPVESDKKQAMKAFSELWDELDRGNHPSKKVALFQLERNKMREQTLKHAMKMLRARAALPDKRLFVLGNRTKIAPHLWTDEDKPAGHNLTHRRTMEMLVSRHIKRAHLLAENAARGKFPSLDPLSDEPDCTRFDYLALPKQFERYIKWLDAERVRLRSIQTQRRRGT